VIVRSLDGRAVDTEVAVVDAIRELLAELRPYAPPPVRLDSDLDRDLGLDSLALAELLVRLETRLEVSLPAAVLRSAATPRDLVRAVRPAPAATRWVASDRAIPQLPAQTPQELDTLAASLEWHAATHPDRVHARIMGEDSTVVEVSYADLLAAARATAAGVLELGVTPGESVALMLPTCREYFTTFLGVLFAGAVPVPIYPPARLAQLQEHLERQSRILDNARATLLVTVPEAHRVSRLLRSSVGSLREVRTPDELPVTGDTTLPVPQADDIALIQYTSGSTGNPKGVVLTHRHLLANIAAMARAARVRPDDTFVSWLPLYHDMGLIGAWLGSLHVGMPLVSMSPLSFLVHPAAWLQAIDEHRATISAAPNFAYELCLRKLTDDDLRSLDLSCWRLAFNGAEAVHPATLRRFAERLAPYGLRGDALLPVYGLAEAAVGLAFPPVGRGPVIDRIHRSTFLTTGRAHTVEDGPGGGDIAEFVACGRPLPGYELRIVDPIDRELPERTEGHIQFRGPSATTGYFRNPLATTALFHGGWLDTGDLGYLAAGDLYVTGRVKDMIIRAGRNLHPDELEQVIGRVAGVRRGCVAVFAAADPAAGTEHLVVVAETRETDETTLAALRDQIIAATVDLVGTPPDDVVLAPPRTVPKTSSGKIRRGECRERYEQGHLGPQRRPVWRQVAHFTIGRLPVRLRRVRRAYGDAIHATLGWMLLVGIGVPLCALLAITPGRRRRWCLARAAARSALRLTNTPVHVHGEPPSSGPAVIVANHGSWVDGIVLAATIPGPMHFVAGEVFEHRMFTGFVLRRIGAVFVERWDHEQGVADAAHLADLPRTGGRLAVFPEGGLSSLPGLRPFHLGGFAAAAAAGVPVVPVAIRGTRWILRPGRRRLRRGAVDIVISSAVEPTGTDWHAAVQLCDSARADILRHCGEPDLT
jgi:1-acyl-sn-glycerol-3-phosphate acyltransferase